MEQFQQDLLYLNYFQKLVLTLYYLHCQKQIESNYYIDPSNITISVLGMPASTNPGTLTNVRSGVGLDNLTYTLPITVPSTATAGTITVNGSATLKYTLQLNQGNVAAPTGGTVNYSTPVQSSGATTAIGTAFYNSPFDLASTRTVVITYTCATTEILVDNSYVLSGFPTGTTPTPVLSNELGQLAITQVIPVLTQDTVVTPVVDSTVGAATATLGNTSTINLPQPGSAQTIASTWNVDGLASPVGSPPASWLSLNSAASGVAIPLSPGVSFTVSAQANNTGAQRTTTIELTTTNTRVTGSAVATQTINVIQAG
jgi:hypothetical protein